MKTDKAWEIWGAQDPYFAVLTADGYRAGNLDAAGREAFFRSGERYVAGLLDTCAAMGRHHFESALDFGCGVGRLVIPLAARCTRVTGVDVSPSMLEEARRNCTQAGTDNVTLVETKRFLDDRGSRFDLVHSVLVFQHIRPGQGLALLAAMLARLEPGGVAAVQLIFGRQRPMARLRQALARLPLVSRLRHRARGRTYVAPMEMNRYELDRVLALLQDHQVDTLRVALSWMDGIRSASLVGVRNRAAPRPC